MLKYCRSNNFDVLCSVLRVVGLILRPRSEVSESASQTHSLGSDILVDFVEAKKGLKNHSTQTSFMLLPNTTTALCLVSPFGTALTRTCDNCQKEQRITESFFSVFRKHVSLSQNLLFSVLSKAAVWTLSQSYKGKLRLGFAVI